MGGAWVSARFSAISEQRRLDLDIYWSEPAAEQCGSPPWGLASRGAAAGAGGAGGCGVAVPTDF